MIVTHHVYSNNSCFLNHAVHLRAAFCDVWCNRVVRRRGFMRPLHVWHNRRERGAATKLERKQPNFPRAPFTSVFMPLLAHYLSMFIPLLTENTKMFIYQSVAHRLNSDLTRYKRRLPPFFVVSSQRSKSPVATIISFNVLYPY